MTGSVTNHLGPTTAARMEQVARTPLPPHGEQGKEVSPLRVAHMLRI